MNHIIIVIFINTLFLIIVGLLVFNKNPTKERNRFDNDLRDSIVRLLLDSFRTITESLQSNLNDARIQITTSLNNHSSELNQRIEKLTETTNKKLLEITNQVDRRLSEGFEKTATTFTDVIKRLALIDNAQKKITELSDNIIDLQEILTDKRARGAFGEFQLSALLRNILPTENFALQHTLTNNRRVDCILFLPEPTGNIPIDAKFPLESYQKLANPYLSEIERKVAQQQFRLDIRKHIQDISEKYIIPGETADGAMMFIPAEAIFAEIHGHYPELVEFSYRSKVWLASPTTLMAILTTARAVIKDSATRKQIHIIQEHLIALSKDFGRFQNRMENLTKHISQAYADAEDANKSAKKISSRFNSIEKVEIINKE
ncbi:MAG: DNA recombination protein RmuC [Coxiellaceae bacterium]|jgi:DNA recombination protein RmuC|nr:DNA recombination protein RmuC [Coxiellaceae bacterium]